MEVIFESEEETVLE
jgi:hypothetical protein